MFKLLTLCIIRFAWRIQINVLIIRTRFVLLSREGLITWSAVGRRLFGGGLGSLTLKNWFLIGWDLVSYPKLISIKIKIGSLWIVYISATLRSVFGTLRKVNLMFKLLTLYINRFAWGDSNNFIVLYVQEVVTRPKILNRIILSAIEFMWPKIILLCKRIIFNLKYCNS